MATAQDIYTTVAYDLLEDGALILGLLTDDQFFKYLNLTILDYIKSTGISKSAYTQQVVQGQKRYDIPEELLRVDSVFCAGRLLTSTTTQLLANRERGWRSMPPRFPSWWHEDELPNRTVEVVPAPNYTGVAIGGSGVLPGIWAGGQSPAVHRNLTMVGPAKPASISAMDDPIPSIPHDVAIGYLAFGLLERVFSGDSDLKDPQRALYCGAQYGEGVSLMQAVTGEVEDE